MAFITVLLRWPDREQARLYVLGFVSVGDIEPSGVFRELPRQAESIDLQEELLGQAAIDFVDELEATRPARFCEEITQQSVEEIDKNHAKGLFSRDQLDELFGRGQWRPLPRFMVEQACGKKRCIDDGARPGHNSATGAWETIFTTSVDFVVSAVAVLIVHVLIIHVGVSPEQSLAELLKLLPDWFQLVIGLNDLLDAYRQCPNAPNQAHLNVVGFLHSLLKEWVYMVLKGHVFGKLAAVLNFCRLPCLTSAFARRIYGVITTAFFDDNATIDLLIASGWGGRPLYSSVSSLEQSYRPARACQWPRNGYS